jgi:hypothetical protein
MFPISDITKIYTDSYQTFTIMSQQVSPGQYQISAKRTLPISIYQFLAANN